MVGAVSLGLFCMNKSVKSTSTLTAIYLLPFITLFFQCISWATPPVMVDRIPGVVKEVRDKHITVVFESDHKPQPGDEVVDERINTRGYRYYHSIWRITSVHGKTVRAEAESVAEEPFVGMKVMILSMSQSDRNHMSRITYHDSTLGLLLHDIHPDERYSLGISYDVIGLLVYSVDPQSPAQQAGILPGDVLISVDGKMVGGGASGFERFTPYFKGVSSVDLVILRKGQPYTIRVNLDIQ